MLTPERIEQNKKEIIQLLTEACTRRGVEPQKLLDYLNGSDFFNAPASTKYHCAFEGGLAEHCLNVYYNFMHLYNYKFPNEESRAGHNFDPVFVTLLHDLDKVNKYETAIRNKKVYSDSGTKRDEMGTFDWVAVKEYATKSASDRFVFGSHESTSEYMASKLVPLTKDESIAILHHMGGMAWDSAKDNISEVFNACPIALLLFQADILSSYIDEKV